MKKYLVRYKPFLLFLVVFLGSYMLLTFGYNYFLNCFGEGKVDLITRIVAKHTQMVLALFYDAIHVDEAINGPFYKVYFQDFYTIRIVEGCNGVSVMILFVSFVLSFTASLKKTVVFILIGLILIHLLNVLRIVFLTILLYHYPEHLHVLHAVLFPIIIYGFVFILWFIWVKKIAINE